MMQIYRTRRVKMGTYVDNVPYGINESEGKDNTTQTPVIPS
jgi:hypothetical protein